MKDNITNTEVNTEIATEVMTEIEPEEQTEAAEAVETINDTEGTVNVAAAIRTARMNELKLLIENCASAYNIAIVDNDFHAMTKADEKSAEYIKEYTKLACEECFDICKIEENPILEAVKRLTFITLKNKDIKDEFGGKTRTIITYAKPIDLGELYKYCHGCGADKDWIWKAERLNQLFAMQQCGDLGVKFDETSYYMQEISRKMDIGETPTSNTQLLRNLQVVITAMIGHPDKYKALSKDVNYLKSIYAKKNTKKALSLICADHKRFRGYLAEVCHRIVTKGKYDVDYKTIKR